MSRAIVTVPFVALAALAVGLAFDGLSSTGAEPQCYEDPEFPGEPTCIDLTPDVHERPVGTEHTLTVRAFFRTQAAGDIGIPGQDIWVQVVQGPNAGTERTGKTNERGEFTTTYPSGGALGTDLIGACIAVPDGDAVTPGNQPECVPASSEPNAPLIQDAAFVAWVDATATPSPEPTPKPTSPAAGGQCYDVAAEGSAEYWCIGIDPDRSGGAVGTERALKVILTLNGSPQPAVPAAIEVASGPNFQEVSAVARGTDANGEISFTYKGDGGTGTDVVRACRATIQPPGCTSVVDEATVEWTAAQGAAAGAEQQPQGSQANPGAGQSGGVPGPAAGVGSLSPAGESASAWAAVSVGLGIAGVLIAGSVMIGSRRRRL
jgi:hypothetical protein